MKTCVCDRQNIAQWASCCRCVCSLSCCCLKLHWLLIKAPAVFCMSPRRKLIPRDGNRWVCLFLRSTPPSSLASTCVRVARHLTRGSMVEAAGTCRLQQRRRSLKAVGHASLVCAGVALTTGWKRRMACDIVARARPSHAFIDYTKSRHFSACSRRDVTTVARYSNSFISSSLNGWKQFSNFRQSCILCQPPRLHI